MKAVILAAGQGTRLAPLTDGMPKPLVAIGGRPLLFRALDHLAAVGITGVDVVVVGGYEIDVLRAALQGGGFADATVILNERYADLGNGHSLFVARQVTRGHEIVQMDGDVLFGPELLPRLLRAPGRGVLAVDVRADLDDETMKVDVDLADGRVVALSKSLARAVGESMGIARLDADLAADVMAELATFEARGLGHEYYERAYVAFADAFRIVDVSDVLVTEIDDAADLARAESLLRG